ncbi:MAG TPA: HNH endonuclease signature motif containing protein [Gemmatimonadaceae bacterium]|nr:HNH endonuclease signature motif containing protein [Gemmatimonadaceae bacterium]
MAIHATKTAKPGRHGTPAKHAKPVTASRPARRSGRRGRRGGGAYAAEPQLTSHPTGRAAYADTRAWLLEQHGPTCAYCGVQYAPRVMTLDHVAPRRGQTAYDRRDNLVLACTGCNAAKRDLAPLAFLLGVRARAANLLRYGAHLSAGLLDLARGLVPGGAAPEAAAATTPMAPAVGGREDSGSWPALDDDGESPYRD